MIVNKVATVVSLTAGTTSNTYAYTPGSSGTSYAVPFVTVLCDDPDSSPSTDSTVMKYLVDVYWSGNNLTLERSTASGVGLKCYCQIIEFDDALFNVYSGTFQFGASHKTAPSIGATVTRSKSWCIHYAQYPSNATNETAAQWVTASEFDGTGTTATNMQIRRYGGASSPNVPEGHWWVVECKNTEWEVHHESDEITHSTTSTTEQTYSIGTPLSAGEDDYTFLLSSYRWERWAGGPVMPPTDQMPSSRLVSTTNYGMRDFSTSAYSSYHYLQLVTLNSTGYDSGGNVYRGTSTATLAATMQNSIGGTVNQDKSIILNSPTHGSAPKSLVDDVTGGEDAEDAYVAVEFASDTAINLKSGYNHSNSNSTYMPWQVVEFPYSDEGRRRTVVT